MSEKACCPNCGAPLPDDAPQGLCPQCLMKRALDSQSDLSTVMADSNMTGSPTVPSPSDPKRTRLGTPLFSHLVESLLTPGQSFGDYRIQRLLGKGGMGEVFEAFHAPSGRWVALKVLNQALGSEEDRARFLREGRLAGSVSHPNCVFVFGTEEIDGNPVIVMELAPGGDLKDLVKQKGPLPPRQAVELTLQIIAGLEAAGSAGVLHRDIKPSNCFLDAQGQAKIGDFGLSITTLAKGGSNLTISGTFLGTPVYASPEQLRGEGLDVRSDIYSLGVTLYYLLTGQVPFDAPNVMNLLTLVLEKAPDAPNRLRPEVPGALARVVLKCLEKRAERRFADYGELRRALLPLSAGTSTMAPLATRFFAGWIDAVVQTVFISYPILSLWTLFTGGDLSRLFTAPNSGAGQLGDLIINLATTLACALYFVVGEGLWGAALGKWVLGLRVVQASTGAPAFGRALFRAVVLVACTSVPYYGFLALLPAGAADFHPAGAAAMALSLTVFSWLVLFSTMRRGNGYAGIHDLASGTRVIVKPSFATESVAPVEAAAIPAPKIHATLGPYGISCPIPAGDVEGLLPGYDPVLRRTVWLHLLPAGAPPVSPERRDVSRSGRLRWLNGIRSGDIGWDAYEAPDGRAFVSTLCTPQPWEPVRRWTLDLAEEMAAANADESLPPLLGLDRIWITTRGRAKLLDFPALAGADHVHGGGEIATDNFNHQKMQEFLYAVASAALVGNADAGMGAVTLSPALGLPLHASAFLNKARTASFDSMQSVLGALRASLGLPAVFTWRRRLVHAGLLLVMPVLWYLLTISMVQISQRAAMLTSEKYPDFYLLVASLKRLEIMDQEAREAEVPPLTGEGTIRGDVTLDGAPVPGASVQLELIDWDVDAFPKAGRLSKTVTAGADGRFAFERLPVAKFALAAYAGQALGTDDMPVRSEQLDREVSIVLQPCGQMTGHVEDAGHNPVANAAVIPVEREAGNALLSPIQATVLRARTDSEGNFLIPRLWPGNWRLQVLAGGHPPERTDWVATGENPVVLTMTSGSTEIARDALEAYVAGHFGEALDDPAIRTLPPYLQPSDFEVAERARANHPAIRAGELAAATALATPFLASIEKPDGTLDPNQASISVLYIMPLIILGLCAPLFTLLAFLSRGGLIFRALGIAVVSRNGERASRGRNLLRGLIAWSPIWFLIFSGIEIPALVGSSTGLHLPFEITTGVAGATFVAAAIYAIVGKRSIQDRLAGTYLVRV